MRRDDPGRLVAALQTSTGRIGLHRADDPRLRPSVPSDRTEADHVLEDKQEAKR